MKDVQLNNETWIEFQERCRWSRYNTYHKDYSCTRGCEERFSCAECYCPRLKKEEIKAKTETKIIL